MLDGYVEIGFQEVPRRCGVHVVIKYDLDYLVAVDVVEIADGAAELEGIRVISVNDEFVDFAVMDERFDVRFVVI